MLLGLNYSYFKTVDNNIMRHGATTLAAIRRDKVQRTMTGRC